MMKPHEFNHRLHQTAARFIADSAFLSEQMHHSAASTLCWAESLAELAIERWLKKPQGKPPWHKGRWKTRGGRDQDRWRGQHGNKERSRRKCREVYRSNDFEWNCRTRPFSARNLRYRNLDEYCRANGIEFRRFVPDRCEWLDGTLTLKDNPDCDYVKGGK